MQIWDNAPTESWFGGFKNERVYGERFETRDEGIAMIISGLLPPIFCFYWPSLEQRAAYGH